MKPTTGKKRDAWKDQTRSMDLGKLSMSWRKESCQICLIAYDDACQQATTKGTFKKDYLKGHYQMLRLIPIKQKLGDHGEWVWDCIG